MCSVSLMHVVFALRAFPIIAPVLPSTFSCFKSSAPLKHLSKQVSRDFREGGPVLAPHRTARMVSVPGTRLFELLAEDCFLTLALSHLGDGGDHTHGSPVCLAWFSLWLLQSLAFLHHSPSALPGCACRCPQPVPPAWHWDLRGWELLPTSLLPWVSRQVPPKSQFEPLGDLSWRCSECGWERGKMVQENAGRDPRICFSISVWAVPVVEEEEEELLLHSAIIGYFMSKGGTRLLSLPMSLYVKTRVCVFVCASIS